MTQTNNTSSFNGLIIEISGKALIQHLYLENINQHQIEIGLPQLDNADRQIKLSQNGDASSPIDLSKYSSIEIVEISQQPPATRQREDVNIEAALSRNQERLSDFYQSYKNDDSSIDWSKIATKITLANTGGVFYDHQDKYTVGFKIEFSPKVEHIEFKDDGGNPITHISQSSLFPAKLQVNNDCPDCDTYGGGFCSPTTSAFQSLQSPPTPTSTPNAKEWDLCTQCGVIYNAEGSISRCFGSKTGGGHSPLSSVTFGFLYDPNSCQEDGMGGSGVRCANCQALYDPPPNASYASADCPASSNGHTHTSDKGRFYWIETDPTSDVPPNVETSFTASFPNTLDNFLMCKICSSLYYPKGDVTVNGSETSTINNACFIPPGATSAVHTQYTGASPGPYSIHCNVPVSASSASTE